MLTWLNASSLYCVLINKNRPSMLTTDFVTAVFFLGGGGVSSGISFS